MYYGEYSKINNRENCNNKGLLKLHALFVSLKIIHKNSMAI